MRDSAGGNNEGIRRGIIARILRGIMRDSAVRRAVRSLI